MTKEEIMLIFNIFCLFGQFVAKNAKHFIVAHTVNEITFFNDFFKKIYIQTSFKLHNCKQSADL